MLSRAIGIVLLFVPGLLAQPAVEFEGRYWLPQLRSVIRVDRNGIGTFE